MMVVFQFIYMLIWYIVISVVCKVTVKSSPFYAIIGVLLAQMICLVILFSLYPIPPIEAFLLEFDPENVTRKDLPFMSFFFVMLGLIPALISSAVLKMAKMYENRKR